MGNTSRKGSRLSLSNGRRLVDDVIHFANNTPLASMWHDFDLAELKALRRRVSPKISWNVLMMKAYGIVSVRNPQLRQMYVKFPWPHIYQHYESVAMLTMSREYRGEERLFFARFNRPEEHSLIQLQDQYDFLRKAPIEEIPQFKTQVRFAACPWFVRRFAWWSLFNCWPQKRSSHMGTFGMSMSGHRGTYGPQLLGPNTTSIGIEQMPRRGQSRFLVTFDHRILDGLPVIEIIEQMYRQLTRTITWEMKNLIREQGGIVGNHESGNVQIRIHRAA